MRSCEDYFNAFDENASGPRGEPAPERDGRDLSCGVCLATLLLALGYMLPAAMASAAAAPF
jgi:hypothetical protein